MADRLQGVWVFDKFETGYAQTEGINYWSWDVDFVSYGEHFTKLRIGSAGEYATPRMSYLYYHNSRLETVLTEGYAIDYRYATITITSLYDDVEDAENLLTVLSTRATKLTSSPDVLGLSVTSSSGVLMRSKGKFCDKDILVTPKVKEITITENGEYTSQVCGFSKVSVNVTGGGGGLPADKYFEGGYASVNLPNATKLKNHSFYKDAVLESVSIPQVVSIGEYVFRESKKLVQIDWSNKITSIGQYAFYACTKLVLTELPSGLTSIGQYAFYQNYKLALTELPSGLTSIGNYTFYDCSALALTELPSGLTSIPNYAFARCGQLALAKLPSGLTSIGSNAFMNCSSLKITEIPSGITSVGNYSFQFCSGLETITFKGTPTSIGSATFSSCDNLTTINVPWAEGAVANAPWGATNATINYNYTGE